MSNADKPRPVEGIVGRTYQFGDRVIFVDENQCEIRGTVRERKEYDDRTELLIELDGGGHYLARLRKAPDRRH